MPALYPARSFVEAGGLMALSGNAAEVIRVVIGLDPAN